MLALIVIVLHSFQASADSNKQFCETYYGFQVAGSNLFNENHTLSYDEFRKSSVGTRIVKYFSKLKGDKLDAEIADLYLESKKMHDHFLAQGKLTIEIMKLEGRSESEMRKKIQEEPQSIIEDLVAKCIATPKK